MRPTLTTHSDLTGDLTGDSGKDLTGDSGRDLNGDHGTALDAELDAELDAQAIAADLRHRNAIYVAEGPRRHRVVGDLLALLDGDWSVLVATTDLAAPWANGELDTAALALGLADSVALLEGAVSARDDRRRLGGNHAPALVVVDNPLDHLALPTPRAPRTDELADRTRLELALASLAADGADWGIHLVVVTPELFDGLLDVHARTWRADILRAA
ncbi:MAG: hypothetical protein GX868_16540 [Actinobacteria bacterium]|nr:hypothetical protein [Actinomycetota bacterium]